MDVIYAGDFLIPGIDAKGDISQTPEALEQASSPRQEIDDTSALPNSLESSVLNGSFPALDTSPA